jgi:hypothetical protein
VLELLEQARQSKGRHKPVLSVGRDGITLGTRCRGGSVHEVASCGTVTVLDRRGKRLGTVYLAYVPEYGQGTMSRELTALLRDVLKRWQGSLPRLCYVTDSGDNETTYYHKVLARMTHPSTGEKLEWLRVADYYHASERLWTMADLLFGKGQRGTAWARKMHKLLLKPSGANRVLHSAAALRDQQKLRGRKLTDFKKAYRYIRERMQYMKYAEYRSVGIPLGSGVTEAGCKTVFTEVKRHALETGRRPADLESAGTASERRLGASVPAGVARHQPGASAGSGSKTDKTPPASSLNWCGCETPPLDGGGSI